MIFPFTYAREITSNPNWVLKNQYPIQELARLAHLYYGNDFEFKNTHVVQTRGKRLNYRYKFRAKYS